MVRILHIIIGLNVGGAELMLRKLVESHKGSARFSHTVISLTSFGEVGISLKTKGIDVYCLNMKSALHIPRVLYQLFCLISKHQPQVVQTWMYHADLLGGIAARMAGIKNIIWGIRTTDVNAAGFSFTVFVRKVCSWLSSSVPRVIVCAAEASRKSHIAVGYDEGRMLVIPNGFDLTLFKPMPRQGADFRHLCGFDDNSVIVGYVGRFHPAKDQANFVCAAGLSVASYPNVYFMMVGRDLVASNTELKSWIIKTGHADHFILLGERPDVPLCLAAMDVFCLTSRTEGFPNVVGEAMAMSLPCVVTDVGDAAVLVANTGVVVPAEDSVAFAKGLNKLLAMPPVERKKLGQSAKARIHSSFSIDKTRERFEELYEEIVRNAG